MSGSFFLMEQLQGALPHGRVWWEFPNEAVMQRATYPDKKTTVVIVRGSSAPEHSHIPKKRVSMISQLLPMFDDMAPLYSPEMRRDAERYLLDKIATFASDGGAKLLGLPLSRAMDDANLKKLADFLLDTKND